MKKALLSIGLIALFLAPVLGQDLEVMETASDGKLMTKRGAPILPEAGDWGIGIDATPFLEYVGNAFNGSAANAAPTWGFTAQAPMTIYGRKVVSDDRVIRGLARIGFTSASTTTDLGGGNESKSSISGFSLVLGAGMEMNKSLSNRIRGYYGAMAVIAMLPNDSLNTTVETTIAGVTTETKNSGGGTFGVGLRAFVGAEYFFAPKMSLGGEFGWGLAFASRSDRTSETAGVSTVTQGKGSAIVIDNDNGGVPGLTGFSGQLALFIYF